MKYRIKEYDPINDIYILQKHFFWFIWYGVSVGSKEKLTKFITDVESKDF